MPIEVTPMLRSAVPASGDGTEKFLLQDELALFVFLAGLVCLVILPANRLLALAAVYVAHYVATGGHVALIRVRLGDVDDTVEQVGFAVLATEVLGHVSAVRMSGRRSRRTHPAEDVIMVGEVCFAILAAIDARRVEIDVVRETHGDV